jgi:hypothetical protein
MAGMQTQVIECQDRQLEMFPGFRGFEYAGPLVSPPPERPKLKKSKSKGGKGPK